ncbi:MAG: hypothetical protein ONB23_11125 [candidate division KSB1 bacterium]|nr:hypothetical protein [candidate division KSB1 bacterium]
MQRLCSVGLRLLLMTIGWTQLNAQTPSLPEAVRGWRLSSVDRYTRDSLYDYMDGGAELYLSFGFQELTVGRYSRAETGDLVAEIYRMDSSANAFGVFVHDRQGEGVGIGQDSEFADGWLRFWKGLYYVSIYAEEPQPEADTAVVELAKIVERRIPESGSRPALLELLPQGGQVARSLRYFHDHVSLNHYYFLHRENLLGLGPDTEGCLARYQEGESLAVAILIRFPSEEAAQNAFRRFYLEYLRVEDAGRWVELPSRRWAAAEARGKLLLAVLECSPRDYGQRWLEEAQRLCGEVTR